MGVPCNCLLYTSGGSNFWVMNLQLQQSKSPWTCFVKLKGCASYWIHYVFQEGTLRKGGWEDSHLFPQRKCHHFVSTRLASPGYKKDPITKLEITGLICGHWCSSVQDILHRIFGDIFTGTQVSTEEHICIQHSFHLQVTHCHQTKSKCQWEMMVGERIRGYGP